MNSTSTLQEFAEEWRIARLLYPFYSGLAREFVIEAPSCPDLEAGVEAPPQESVQMARQWFADMDSRIQVHQLRQFLQTSSQANDQVMRVLLAHHLHKPSRSDSDRDKIDFLLVQFFSQGTPSRLEDADVDLDYVAQMLEPVLGTVDLDVPAWIRPLDEFIAAANQCHGLNDLLASGILDKGRKLKTSAGTNYFQPVAMVAFTRFSFLMRRVFFRLMHHDLNAIQDGLRELESHGIASLDCRHAQFSSDEPTARLRMICQSWRVMFHAEYSSGQPLRMLADLRAVIDAAVARAAKRDASADAPTAAPKARAAAAGAGSSATTDAAEFEVSAAPSFDGDAVADAPWTKVKKS